jgi:hypothetical protein
MSNGKLRLNLAALRVKSFKTTPSSQTLKGTVLGMDDSNCTQATWCTVDSCTNTECAGASIADSTVPMSYYCPTYHFRETCYGEETCQ